MSVQTYSIVITIVMLTATACVLYAAHHIGKKKFKVD